MYYGEWQELSNSCVGVLRQWIKTETDVNLQEENYP